ncbi:site-specific DNA-methyltransferase [Moraxella osloensis]|uniref:site-specific DNA-methyltransferase (adenine-specific) n=1 Tax=Faucicola osloensis TaxID=34062 RepID=A0A6P1KGA6_FAUOS|nr:site-specific DNA-methyltransferase [Moraxella osloensis]QHG10411.1 site-specific DNA-methyltransferase [Moraxella osloensis]
MTTLKMHTSNLVDSNIERLAELFPNCVTEKPKTDEQGKVIRDMNGEVVLERGIDFELLKQELSHSVIDGSQERYRLDWVGKREAIVTANSPIAKTLRPCREESVDFETTGNLFIEGDNLEALKLLQESYLGKVKMIYIDPPYNTGNDFIYNDDFAADTAEFFERSGQVDGDGNRLVANTESNGRFHSDWLSMMYSRLKLARNLLSDDGVIFISIHDVELYNLKKICDEVFSINNFSGQITWKARVKPVNIGEAKYRPQKEVDYVLIYTKSYVSNTFFPVLSGECRSYPHNLEGRKYRLATILKSNRGTNFRASMTFKLGDYFPPDGQRWQAGEAEIKKLSENGYIEFKNGTPFRRYFEDEELSEHIPFYCYMPQDLSSTSEDGKHTLNDLVGNHHGFDTVKPVDLIRTLIQATTQADKNSIILDFFAGSATTAQAVIEANISDEGNRRYILVQVKEKADPKKTTLYEYIPELSKLRIDSFTKTIDKEKFPVDVGYRYLKIDTSNMNDIYYRPQDYNQDLLATLENNIKPDRSDEDLLFQFMLDTGVPLSLPIERTELSSKSGGHTIYQVGGNSLIASLDYIDANMVNDIAALNPLKFITSERAIATDSDKTNIKERFKQLSPHTDVRFI